MNVVLMYRESSVTLTAHKEDKDKKPVLHCTYKLDKSLKKVIFEVL
jgi:hypothetical protein